MCVKIDYISVTYPFKMNAKLYRRNIYYKYADACATGTHNETNVINSIKSNHRLVWSWSRWSSLFAGRGGVCFIIRINRISTKQANLISLCLSASFFIVPVFIINLHDISMGLVKFKLLPFFIHFFFLFHFQLVRSLYV